MNNGNQTSIAHGMLVGSMFSAMIGNYVYSQSSNKAQLPGVIYMKQTLTFPNPTIVNSDVLGKNDHFKINSNYYSKTTF